LNICVTKVYNVSQNARISAATQIHKFREEHAKSFNYDLDAMFADWQRKQAEGVNLPPKRGLTTPLSGRVRDLGGDAE
jgi:hypothetical protein